MRCPLNQKFPQLILNPHLPHGRSTTVGKDSEENLQVVAMYLGGFLWSFTSFDRMGALAMSIVELARGAAGGQSQ